MVLLRNDDRSRGLQQHTGRGLDIQRKKKKEKKSEVYGQYIITWVWSRATISLRAFMTDSSFPVTMMERPWSLARESSMWASVFCMMSKHTFASSPSPNWLLSLYRRSSRGTWNTYNVRRAINLRKETRDAMSRFYVYQTSLLNLRNDWSFDGSNFAPSSHWISWPLPRSAFLWQWREGFQVSGNVRFILGNTSWKWIRGQKKQLVKSQ